MIRDYDQSLLWERLDKLSRSDAVDRVAVDHLKSSVRRIVDRASWISTQICRYMPQYTLHEERHFLNVLAIMEALVPGDLIHSLSPLECALPILAAYTHDLGMALSQEEHDLLLDESTEQGKHFASYRSRFDEEIRQIDRWRKRLDGAKEKDDDESKHEAVQAERRIASIEGHILSSYLRDTHTKDDQVRRLRRWLDAIKKETGDDNVFCYGVGGRDYQRELTLIGISHGRGAPWLRRQLIGDDPNAPQDRFFQPVATGESANLAFPGLLLRLADVMDFDASRAPRILFKHFGIENDQSVLEWNKHLSIVGWRLDVDPDGKQQPDLLYSAECKHPVHEKAIREFKTWIDAELSAVRIELDAQRRQLPAAAQTRYDLHLPSQTRLDIRSARDPLTDQPKYVYHDLQFRLDQDEIQQLLMGESLYGDPGLCIRELLQNALDALELRELRLKMKQKGEAREPVDGELIRPGWVREPDGREEELRVTLDWGTDEETGQQWLRVSDNGVGMTEEVIKNYFTQIGKSYYRSPEFNQERAAMKAAGEVVSPISIFGIGILSCFMIGDRVEVRTCTDRRVSLGHAPCDVTISGPGSLFWFKGGTLQQTGSEIKVFLKPRFQIEQKKNRKLRKKAKGKANSKGKNAKTGVTVIDPAEIVLSNVLWPCHPVVIRSGQCQTLRVDEHRPTEELRGLGGHGHADYIFSTWELPKNLVGRPSWGLWKWIDSLTGTRICFAFPMTDESDELPTVPIDFGRGQMRQDAWAAIVESKYAHQKCITINGMHVEESGEIAGRIGFDPGIGARVWIDLRGDVTPRLTADRRRAIRPIDAIDWSQRIRAVFNRAHRSLIVSLKAHGFEAYRNTLTSLRMPELTAAASKNHEPVPQFSLVSACKLVVNEADTPIQFELAYVRFMQSLGIGDRDPEGRNVIQPYGRLRNELSRVFDFKYPWTNYGRKEARERTLNFARRVCKSDDLDFELKEDTDFDDDPDGALSIHERQESDYSDYRDSPTLRLSLIASILQEAFNPSLESSWPSFGLFTLAGRVADATLVAPGVIALDIETDGRTLHFADPQGENPAKLVLRGYDLTFPMTAVPLGQLRRECGEWRSDRWYRPLGVAPFLLPALRDVWPAHAEFLQESFKVPHIYCLLPRFELWSKRFRDWTDADWRDPENLSALWDLSGHLTGTPGQVLWARGAHDINVMPRIGLPAPQFLSENS